MQETVKLMAACRDQGEESSKQANSTRTMLEEIAQVLHKEESRFTVWMKS